MSLTDHTEQQAFDTQLDAFFGLVPELEDVDIDQELDLDLQVTIVDEPPQTIYASGTCGGCPKPSDPGSTCQFTCQNTCGGTCSPPSCGGTCDASVCVCPTDACSGFFCF